MPAPRALRELAALHRPKAGAAARTDLGDLIHVARRLLRGTRKLRLRLACTLEELALFTKAREVMRAMAAAPSTG